MIKPYCTLLSEPERGSPDYLVYVQQILRRKRRKKMKQGKSRR